jgi:hypothetical protein
MEFAKAHNKPFPALPLRDSMTRLTVILETTIAIDGWPPGYEFSQFQNTPFSLNVNEFIRVAKSGFPAMS